MPTIRLFAQARERAGTSTLHVDGTTVGEVVAALKAQFDAEFTQVFDHSRLWLNAHPIEGEWSQVAVGESDELAVVPPVSGGCV